MDSADPWIARYKGFYYFTATLDPDHGVWIWKARTLTGLDKGEKVNVWSAPRSGPESRGIWAPEMHLIDGHWYLYFTATDGEDGHHRMFVLESASDDPMGPYQDRGRVDPTLDHFAIDGSVLRMPDGRLYFLYSTGKLWIAPMSSPARVDPSRRVEICHATLPWERFWVEAPEPLVHDGRVFLTYSAGHSGTPHYSLGLLTLHGNDPLAPGAWSKSAASVFSPYFGPDGAAYCVGHNGFTTSPDGKQDWIVYHAKDWRTDERKDMGFNGRTTRVQPFEWSHQGTPMFGHPIPSEVAIPLPSGE